MNDEISVSDGQRLLDTVRRKYAKPGHSICGFTELHHQ